MRNLGDTVARLRVKAAAETSAAKRLAPVQASRSNPGNLSAWKYVPQSLPDAPALVVVLHGCTQTAAAYDLGAGWSTLAELSGFIVLYPEQQRANNPGLCFNWYSPGDAKREEGEAASIQSIIEATILQHNIDRSRVFITGLSAGGAMTAAMLATYPEVFAGGAIIAGLPYGCAKSMPDAFDRMRGQGLPSAAASAAAVLTASGHSGPFPAVSIWHGSADRTVSPSNADALLAQWAGVHDLEPVPDEIFQGAGHTHRVWKNAKGEIVLEDYRIAGMGHGTPVDTQGSNPCGKAGPYMLEAGVSSTRLLVERWKLAGEQSTQTLPPSRSSAVDPHIRSLAVGGSHKPARPTAQPPASGLQTVIEDALRRAGLMK